MTKKPEALYKFDYNIFDDENEIDDYYRLYKNIDANEKGEFFLDIIAIYYRLEIFLDINENGEFVFHNTYSRSAWDEEYKRNPIKKEDIEEKTIELINDFISKFKNDYSEEKDILTDDDIKKLFLNFHNINSPSEIPPEELNNFIYNFFEEFSVNRNKINDSILEDFKKIIF